MFINPIQYGAIGDLSSITGAGGIGDNRDRAGTPEEISGAGFVDVFKSAWDAASDSQQDLAEKQYLQSIGEINDTHTVPIAQAEAELSLSLMVGLRNKALDSYNELMRMNV